MTTKLISKNDKEAKFEIDIDNQSFEKALLVEYRQWAADNNQPAPAPFLSTSAMLEQCPERQKLYSLTLDKLLLPLYMEAIQELKLKPLTFPELKPYLWPKDMSCQVEVRVLLEPPVELKQFEGLKAAYTPIIVTDADVEHEIEGLRKQNGDESSDESLLEKMKVDSLDALRAELRKSLEELVGERVESLKKEAVLDALVAANPIDLPEAVIEQQVNIKLQTLKRQIGDASFDSYMKASGRNIDELKYEIRKTAAREPSLSLLLAAVADQLELVASEEEIDQALAQQSDNIFDGDKTVAEIRQEMESQPGVMEQFCHNLRREKATQYVIDHAVLTALEPQSVIKQVSDYLR